MAPASLRTGNPSCTGHSSPCSLSELLNSRSRPKLFGDAWIESSGFLMLDFFFVVVRYYLDTLLDQNQAPAAHLCLLIPCSYISITPEVPPFSPGAVPVTARLSAGVAWWPVWLQVCATDTAVEAAPTGMGSSAFTGGLSGWAETWLQHRSSGLMSGADAQGSTFQSCCCLSSPGAVRRAGRGLQVKSSFSFGKGSPWEPAFASV